MLGMVLMSRQMLVYVGLLLLGFVFGISLGLYAGGGVSASGPSVKSADSSSSETSSSPEASGQVQANTLLSDRIRELEKQLAEQKKVKDSAVADRIAFFNKNHDSIRLSAFDNNLKMTPEMAELLGLSKDEQQEIEQHLAEAKSEMDKLEDADTVLVKHAADSATLEVSANPQGKAIKDKLTGSLSADIGDDRATFLMGYTGNSSSDGTFSGFAEQKKEIEITWAQQNGSLLYTIKNDYFGPNGGTGSMTSGFTSLPPQYQKFLQGDSTPAP